MQDVLLSLQEELERLASCCTQLSGDNEAHARTIDDLVNMTRALELNKADKEDVRAQLDLVPNLAIHRKNKATTKFKIKGEGQLGLCRSDWTVVQIDSSVEDEKVAQNKLLTLTKQKSARRDVFLQKADKHQLDGKVDRSVFDSTTQELNRMIADLLQKLGDQVCGAEYSATDVVGFCPCKVVKQCVYTCTCSHFAQEEEWKRLLGELSSDLDGKLDRLEFSAIRQELEKRLKALAKQLKNMDSLRLSTEDDAAGIRK